LLPNAEWLGAENMDIARCACDPSEVRPGDLFAALTATCRDGRKTIAEAVARGAGAVLTEQPLPGLELPVCVVPNVRDAFGRISQALAGNPSHALKVIGIGGTNGKTTTSCLIASVLTTAGHRVGLAGSLGYLDGAKVEPAPWTTPRADRLAELLARMVNNGCSHAAVAVSGSALGQSRLAGVRLGAACVTNFAPNRPEGRRPTAARLFEHLAPAGFAVVNADDPVAAHWLRGFQGPALTIGIDAQAEITATPLEQLTSEQTFLLTAGSDTMPVRTRMIGTHHIYNCLTAAAVGLAYEIELPVVVRGLEAVEHVPGRLQRIECGQPFGVFVDSARTTGALAGCLQTLRSATSARLICVFGTGNDHRRQHRPRTARVAERDADLLVVTSDTAAVEGAQAVEDFVACLAQPSRAHAILDRAAAIRWGLAQAQPGDCVLIIGGDPTSDQQTAEAWLYEVKPYATC
jgi:UDP-N-acetylmuramoyl-L-alanyl-D-glutamate--2,6-diaminopimelate ligase